MLKSNINAISNLKYCQKIKNKEQHPYHILKPNPLPLLITFTGLIFIWCFSLYIGCPVYADTRSYAELYNSILPDILNFGLTVDKILLKFENFNYYQTILTCSACLPVVVAIVSASVVIFQWSEDILVEAYRGDHTAKVRRGLKFGFLLFMFSELCFFLSGFMGVFYVITPAHPFLNTTGTAPTIHGRVNSGLFSRGALNTALLFFSSICFDRALRYVILLDQYNHFKMYFFKPYIIFKTTTQSSKHKRFISFSATVKKIKKIILVNLYFTVIIGLVFLASQIHEYSEADFSMSSSAFGSLFYLLTGTHGLHVLIGLNLILDVTYLLHGQYFTKKNNLGGYSYQILALLNWQKYLKKRQLFFIC